MNLANRITVARVLLMPVVIFFMLTPMHFFRIAMGSTVLYGNQLLATVLFVIATISDGIDGYIARNYNQITNFGKFLDPLADKVLVNAVLIALAAQGSVAAWVVIVIVSREFAVTGLRLIAVDDGIVIAAGSLGKWKTRVQMVALVALLLNNFPFSLIHVPFATIAIDLAVVLTILSGVDYFVKNWNVIRVSQ
ncbi:CDP-diacylglycerol--glycerol-3-phosphate 3-phosphatidyltransferase [Ferroacidibacillus organovorans]|uniref:CDP-diacylglycerol--glycerol-3-phosphate 3-phosphatidyltransferase n=1 Tax=Ferroacidibacillus organovorans TaxID=1765683 RepID=A0A853K8N2_9BACL|nr:CDP-diacylglycerol--glycerol-3-phosphate 3-phosphatidyltransferase [Ferroacidibacillus organovorans]KYP79383.1 CDP-diacylglycerol--glycerol-3-phosphate 3-phosphatidyltransferase [Ferroacidibacillus organovorans]OAG90175.1 CDP-diacylglycerol--glycerol-3-phosphate 3-phosphatidyltransferase [Ferroacidibacillus organovorans]